jgi:hypothetical protein
MNQRIQELYTQALENKFDYSGGNNVKPGEYYSNYKTVLNAEKFAELIVKECATAITNDDLAKDCGTFLMDSYAKGMRYSANLIKEHFGVEG